MINKNAYLKAKSNYAVTNNSVRYSNTDCCAKKSKIYNNSLCADEKIKINKKIKCGKVLQQSDESWGSYDESSWGYPQEVGAEYYSAADDDDAIYYNEDVIDVNKCIIARKPIVIYHVRANRYYVDNIPVGCSNAVLYIGLLAFKIRSNGTFCTDLNIVDLFYDNGEDNGENGNTTVAAAANGNGNGELLTSYLLCGCRRYIVSFDALLCGSGGIGIPTISAEFVIGGFHSIQGKVALGHISFNLRSTRDAVLPFFLNINGALNIHTKIFPVFAPTTTNGVTNPNLSYISFPIEATSAISNAAVNNAQLFTVINNRIVQLAAITRHPNAVNGLANIPFIAATKTLNVDGASVQILLQNENTSITLLRLGAVGVEVTRLGGAAPGGLIGGVLENGNAPFGNLQQVRIGTETGGDPDEALYPVAGVRAIIDEEFLRIRIDADQLEGRLLAVLERLAPELGSATPRENYYAASATLFREGVYHLTALDAPLPGASNGNRGAVTWISNAPAIGVLAVDELTTTSTLEGQNSVEIVEEAE